ncbi:uncharacterized protein MAL13P1.304-like isoform X3 [Microplitis mediator]|uniref:uncharacterized protein MAL13P1.304-like isoform X3 n=1 Tax=Microplitis mediator TaxID=375433 RepID=UPI002554C016|nr:uncharacterized protein MAL13P1.304-like isoform X3 [Microplitis mediator]
MVEHSESGCEEAQSVKNQQDVANLSRASNHNNNYNNETIKNSNRFSLFKWFKPKTNEKIESHDLSACSSTSSVDTLYSTTTVRSFAFHSGSKNKNVETVTLDLLKHNNKDLGPFGSGASKIIHKNNNDQLDPSLDVTRTLPSHVLSQKRDITTRYSLQTCSTNFGSCDNITQAHNLIDNNYSLNKNYVRKRLHVKGKRRAPQPPRPKSVCNHISNSAERRKRQAPKPPGWNKIDLMDKKNFGKDNHTNHKCSGQIGARQEIMMNEEVNYDKKYQQNQSSISNDTLVLRGGVLVAKKENLLNKTTSPIKITATPKPWYKRSVFETKKTDKDSSSFDDSDPLTTKINFFYRDKTEIKDDKRKDKDKDTKRKSGLCILTNISELDKEAAAIVQEEQAKTRAAIRQQQFNGSDNIDKYNDNQEEIVQDIVTSSIENSPKRGTRALISKFNAIGNITKVTVNSNFFNKNLPSPKFDRNWNSAGSSANKDRVEPPDLSRYFPDKNKTKNTQSAINASRTSFLQSTLTDNTSDKKLTEPHKLINDVTNRLTALQSIVATNSSKESTMRTHSPVFYRRDKKVLDEQIIDYKSSPKVYRAHDKTNSKDIQNEFSDLFKEIDRQLNFDIKNEELHVKKTNDSNNSAASKVSKVLDILVEAEGIKNKTDGDHKRFDKNSKAVTNVCDDKVTDLKEMLKEMKHSLPKRPKAKNKTREFIKNSETKNFCDSIVISNPPVIQIGPSTSTSTSVSLTSSSLSSFGNKDERKQETDKGKVSSSVQTCGNLRRVTNNSVLTAVPSTSQQWKDDVIYRTNGRSSKNRGLVKNRFQLMRPREFAAIEAIKTMKITNQSNNEDDDNNTYANVMEQSLYANALVLPSRNHQIISNSRIIIDGNDRDDFIKRKDKIPVPDLTSDNNKYPVEFLKASGSKDNEEEMTQNMNTLAVNRLLKKLEGAIASGNHQKAAGFAKELAHLKIQCSVVRQRPKIDDLLNVDMYIEDRLAHQGPIPLQLPISMTVRQLKVKIFNEFEIPANVQRWIIGKTLAENDDATLEDLKAIEGTPVFLYLVAPDLQIADINNKQFNKVLDQNHLTERLLTINNNNDDSDNDKNKHKKKTNQLDKEKKDDYQINLTDEKNKQKYLPKSVDPVKKSSLIFNVKKSEAVDDDDDDDDDDDQGKKIENFLEINKKIELKNMNKVCLVNKQVEEGLEEGKIIFDNQIIEGAAALPKNNNNDNHDNNNNDNNNNNHNNNNRMEQYTQLMMLENCEIVLNVEPIECPICFVVYDPLEGVVLRDCLHSFCRGCIENTIKYCNEAEVKCPYRDSEYTCESTLQEREIKALVNPQIYEQHLAKSVAQAENNAGHNAFHCKTPDCPGWCIYDDNVNNFLCPVCNKNNCLTCRSNSIISDS